MTNLRPLRFVLVAAGLLVAAPSFASGLSPRPGLPASSPLCGDEKGGQDKHDDKVKSENKKEKEPKKPTNPA